MCGLAGIFTTNPDAVRHLLDTAEHMASKLAHRGPDAAGSWVDAANGIALTHRRLAVIDLSPAGDQPMLSASRRFVLAFNGEIYNHQQLRAEIHGTSPDGRTQWRGHSDTESLLAGFEVWGIEETLRKTVGMFAIAVWDSRERMLYLARDRFGEKPLYYGWSGGAFVFGSELKALRAVPGFTNPLCLDALEAYFALQIIPAPYSIYQGIYKLEPGCVLSIASPEGPAPREPLRAGSPHPTATVRRWWSLAAVAEASSRDMFVDEATALDALHGQIRQAVELQSMADVPLGAFLSGGIDSTLIVALMQEASGATKTFSVGFEHASFDESPHARTIARHLKTDHHELFVTSSEALAVVPSLPEMFDEPFADSSQIPTHLVCRAARRSVTVALSGDAGDEIFGGYNRYFWASRLWAGFGRMPQWIRDGAGATLRAAPPGLVNAILGNRWLVRPGDKMHKFGHALRNTRTLDDLYANLLTAAHAPGILAGHVSRGVVQSLLRSQELPTVGSQDPRATMMLRDALLYLPDDILCKVDRASMASSLETRAPYLDHRVAELAWRLPMSMKIRGGTGKWALRRILNKYVPSAMLDRPKAGFAVPLAQWLRGPLRKWADDLLMDASHPDEPYLRSEQVQRIWRQHLAGTHDWSSALWSILMFQSWRKRET